MLLFLFVIRMKINKKIETIRLYKDASKRYLEIKDIIKGKQDAQEIKNDILKLV